MTQIMVQVVVAWWNARTHLKWWHKAWCLGWYYSFTKWKLTCSLSIRKKSHALSFNSQYMYNHLCFQGKILSVEYKTFTVMNYNSFLFNFWFISCSQVKFTHELILLFKCQLWLGSTNYLYFSCNCVAF